MEFNSNVKIVWEIVPSASTGNIYYVIYTVV